jgi:hypothetical protein
VDDTVLEKIEARALAVAAARLMRGNGDTARAVTKAQPLIDWLAEAAGMADLFARGLAIKSHMGAFPACAPQEPGEFLASVEAVYAALLPEMSTGPAPGNGSPVAGERQWFTGRDVYLLSNLVMFLTEDLSPLDWDRIVAGAMQYGQSARPRPEASEYDRLLRVLLNGDPRQQAAVPGPGKPGTAPWVEAGDSAGPE